ncbi:MAG: hypothetical protein U1E39_09715 [Planctomycetota bacterium]
MTVPPVAYALLAVADVVLGASVLRRLRTGVRGVEAFAWSVALGTGLASLWAFVLVATGVWARVAVAPTAAIVTAVAPAAVLATLDALRRRAADPAPRGPTPRAFDPWLVPPALVAGVLLVAALAPDVGFDALVYHLPAAARVARDGLGPLPGCFDGELRLGFDLLWARLLRLDGALPAGPAVFHALAGVGLAAGVFAETRRRAGAAAAGVVATLLLLSPEVARLATTAYVDLGVGLYGFVAIAAVARAHRGEPGPNAALAGVFAGFAANAKLNALAFLPVVALALLAGGPRGGRPRPALVATACGALVAAPWVVRAALATGNPAFPALASAFGTGWATPETVRLAARTVLDQTGLPRDALLGPRGVLHGVFDPAWAFQTPAFVLALLPAAATRPDTPERRGLLVAGVLSAVAGPGSCRWRGSASRRSRGRGRRRRRRRAARRRPPPPRRRGPRGRGGPRGRRRLAAAPLLPRLRAVLARDAEPAYAREALGAARGAAHAAAGARHVGLAAHVVALVGPDAVSLTPQRNGVLVPSDLDDPVAYLAGCRRLGLTTLVLPDGPDAKPAWARLVAAWERSGDVVRVTRPVRGWQRVTLAPR